MNNFFTWNNPHLTNWIRFKIISMVIELLGHEYLLYQTIIVNKHKYLNMQYTLYSCAWNVSGTQKNSSLRLASLIDTCHIYLHNLSIFSLACSTLAESICCCCCFSQKMATKTKRENRRKHECNGGKPFLGITCLLRLFPTQPVWVHLNYWCHCNGSKSWLS